MAPPTPFKFLDIGTKMGSYKIGDHIPARKDTTNIFHPRFVGEGIPPANTFHAVMHERAAKWIPDGEAWCIEEAWFACSPEYDFRVTDPSGYIWGLPAIVPTCPKKLFASSSDLITWNTLVMMKLQWIDSIPREWIEITTQSLEAWNARDEQSPFLPDNRRGYARVTPIALYKLGIPDSAVLTLSEYPLQGLGLYDDLETCEQYSGYVWFSWTTKTVQPAHIDSALQAMIDQSSRQGASAAGEPSRISDPSTLSTTTGFKGSYASTFPSAPPYPDSSGDVNMKSSADKRSRESPDSTLKPAGKLLKTSGVATATSTKDVMSSSCATDSATFDGSNDAAPKAPTIRWRAKDAAEAKQSVRQMHRRIPAWKLKLCAEVLNASPADLARIAEVTEIQFATVELVDVAAQCLIEIAKEIESANVSAGAADTAAAAPSQDEKESVSDKSASPEPERESKTTAEGSADKDDLHKEATDRCATAQDPSKSNSTAVVQSQGATASLEGSASKRENESTRDSTQGWITRFLKGEHDLLWPTGLAPSTGPTLLTGVKMGDSDHLIDNLMEWEGKFESADLEKHKQFLQEAQLIACDNPLEATAWENGYVPEARGLPSDQLDIRIQGALPPLAYMVSRPRQPITAGEELWRRFDAGVRLAIWVWRVHQGV